MGRHGNWWNWQIGQRRLHYYGQCKIQKIMLQKRPKQYSPTPTPTPTPPKIDPSFHVMSSEKECRTSQGRESIHTVYASSQRIIKEQEEQEEEEAEAIERKRQIVLVLSFATPFLSRSSPWQHQRCKVIM